MPVGFRVVTQWSQIRPECERLSQTVITDDAKELLSKKVKQLTSVPSGVVYVKMHVTLRTVADAED